MSQGSSADLHVLEEILTLRCVHHRRRSSLLCCAPHTGRTHQIRLHLAHVDHPIAGDEIYGLKVCLPQHPLMKSLFAYAASCTVWEGASDAVAQELV